MRTILFLLALAAPVHAQDSELPPILISPEERQAIIDLVQKLQDANERLGKGLKNCMTARSA